MDTLEKTAPRYIVIDAPGCHGDWAEIYSAHDTLAEARRAACKNKRRMVTTDGGWRSSHEPGCMIHRQHLHAYGREG